MVKVIRKLFFIFFVSFSLQCLAQQDSAKLVRAFPITDYIIDINDSVKLVQVELPDETSFKEKQFGVIRGVYESAPADTVQKGYGRCQLIKGNYYYFAIGNNNSGVWPRAGDLLYTRMDKPGIYYGQIPKLAAHFIGLQNIYEKKFYDRYTVFYSWTENMENKLIDSMVNNIRFTGQYFLENDLSLNKNIEAGDYKGRPLLHVMKECMPSDITAFLDYMILRPRLYAGKQWKLSEVFATWLVSGSPRAVKK